MAKIGKKYKAARENIDRKKIYSLEEAIKLIKDNSKSKFDETIEIAMNLGVDPRHADQMVRGVCQLPNGSGRNVKVAVFARDAKAEEAKAAQIVTSDVEPTEKPDAESKTSDKQEDETSENETTLPEKNVEEA